MRSLTSYFTNVVDDITLYLASAPDVEVGEWQAIQGDIPQARTIEIEDYSFEIPIGDDIEYWQMAVQPNLPWAEEHFLERVSGIPHNPPPSHVRWPYAQRSNDQHITDEKFSHTYPERFWPKYADGISDLSPLKGIRYNYGDLSDVVTLLRERPGTRQAYLPVWFPEDTGAADGQRVPCTLGYHFLVRGGRLKIVYYIRSCDFYRHFRDDVYMAGRLGQWVAEQLVDIYPAKLVMHISSLHIFTPERGKVVAEAEAIKSGQLNEAVGTW